MNDKRISSGSDGRWLQPDRNFMVGEFRVKPLEGLIEAAGEGQRRVEPKAMGVLACLASCQGRTVTKRALFDRVWPDAAVTDHVLTRCISQLRKAMGDNGSRQTVIQTVYKRGYRLLSPVSFESELKQIRNPVATEVWEAEPAEDPRSFDYRQILSATRDHIYLYDRNCSYLFANPAGAKALGLKSQDMIGKHWRELGLVAEILEPFEAQVRICFKSGKPFLERVGYPTVYGERLYEYSLDPVPDADGAIVAVLAVVRDITSRCQEFRLRQDRNGGVTG